MIISKLALIGVLTLSFTLNAEVQFEGGPLFTLSPMEGPIQYTCSENGGGLRNRTGRCRENLVDPGRFDYLISHEMIAADQVVLKALHADGSTREKSHPYDSELKRTKKKVNLLVRTLFQRPLLELGENIISYEFQKDRKTVISGQFKVLVKRNQTVLCRRAFLGHIGWCQSAQNMCRRYFTSGHCPRGL